MRYVAQINREGKGIKMHWDYGLKIDFRTKRHRLACYTATFVRGVLYAATTLLFVPIEFFLIKGSSCIWADTDSTYCTNISRPRWMLVNLKVWKFCTN